MAIERTRDVFTPRVRSNYNQHTNQTNLRLPTGIYRGIVIDDADPDKLNRVKVYIPGLHGEVEYAEGDIGTNYSPNSFPSAIWCRVLSSMGGTTQENAAGGQNAYGLNGFKPTKDNEVLVAFGSDSNAGVVLGVLPQNDKTRMTGAGPTAGITSDGKVGVSQEVGRSKRPNDKPPAHPLQANLDNQGLGKDRIRGLSFSSMIRDPAPRVLGLTSPEGHAITLDDGNIEEEKAGSGIRMRSVGGAQVLLDDTNGLIYIINKDGTAWIELNRNGDIDVFGKQSINVSTLGDMNFSCGGQFNLHATEGINVQSDGEDGIKMISSAGETNLFSEFDYNVQTAANANLNAAGSYKETAQRIDMNGPEASKATKPIINQLVGNKIILERIATRVPEPEPWSGHLDFSVVDQSSASAAESAAESQSTYFGTPVRAISHGDQSGESDRLNHPETPATPGGLLTYEANVDRRLNPGLVSILENIARQFGRPLHIISGYRSPTYNARVGGAKRSTHMTGRAVDITLAGISFQDRLKLIQLASAAGAVGIGLYNNSLHIDNRDGARVYWGPSFSASSTPSYAVATLRRHAAGSFG